MSAGRGVALLHLIGFEALELRDSRKPQVELVQVILPAGGIVESGVYCNRH